MFVKHKYLRISVATVIAVALSACMTVGDERVKQASSESLQQKIVRGKTTKAEVRTLFGNPAEIGFSDSGNEQWSYEYQQVNVFKVYGALFSGGRTDEGGKKIVVLFDKNGIVLNYSVE